MGCHQRDQSESAKELWRQGGYQVLGPGIPPRAAPIDAGLSGTLGVQPEGTHFRCLRLRSLPLSPHQTAQSPSNPCIQFLDWPTTLGKAPMARSNSPTLGHPKFPQAGRSDYDDSGVMAMRAAASLRR